MEEEYRIEVRCDVSSYQSVIDSDKILRHLQKINGKISLCSREGMEQEILLFSSDGILFHYEGNILGDKPELQKLEKTLKDINGIE